MARQTDKGWRGVCFAFGCFLAVASARAGSYIWDAGGGAANTNWSVGVNWTNTASPDVAPLSTDDAVFNLTGSRQVGIATGDQAISNVFVTGSGKWTWRGTNVLNVGGVFDYRGSDNSTLSAPLAGAGSVYVGGSGGLMLNPLTNTFNTFAGNVVVTGGVLAVGGDVNNTSIGNGMLILTGGAVTAYGQTRTVTNAVSLDGNMTFGSMAFNSTGRDLVLQGNVALTGNRTIGTVAGGNGSFHVTFAGTIDDGANSFSLTHTGGARMTIVNASTFDGGVVVSGGGLNIGHNQSLGTGGLTLGGCAFHSTYGDRVIPNNLTLAGDVVFGWNSGVTRLLTFSAPVLLTGNRTITCVSDSAPTVVNVQFDNAIGDGGNGYGLTKTGGARLYLNGANTFLGPLTINAGAARILSASSHAGGTVVANATLEVAANNALGTGPFTLGHVNGYSGIGAYGGSYAATNAMLLAGNIYLQADAGGTTIESATARILTLSGACSVLTPFTPVLNEASSRESWLTGPIAAVYDVGLIKQGAGSVILAGSNTFTGDLRVDGGLLRLAVGGAAGKGGVFLNAGTLVAEAVSGNGTLGRSAVTLNDSAATLQLNTTNTLAASGVSNILFRYSAPSLLVNGVIGGTIWTAGNLARAGRGVLILKGTGTSSALTTNDRLRVASAPVVTNGMVAPYYLETTGDFLTYDGAGRGFQRVAAYPGGDVNTNTAVAIYSPTVAQTLTGNREVFALRTGVNMGGVGQDLTVGSGGVLVSGTPTFDCNLQFNGNEGIFYNSGTVILNGQFKGANGVTKCGGGTLILSNQNTYAGLTTIHAGTMRLGVNEALPLGGALAVTTGTLDLNNRTQSVVNLTLGRCLITGGGAASVLNVSGLVTYTGAAVMNSGGSWDSAMMRASSAYTNIFVNLTGPVVFDVADGPAPNDLAIGPGWIYTGGWGQNYATVTGTGTTPILKKGAGTLVFNSQLPNSFLGDITVEDGTFASTAAGGQPFGNAANKVYLRRNGILTTGAGGASSLASLEFGGGNAFGLGDGTISATNSSVARAAGSRGTLRVMTQYGSSGYSVLTANDTFYVAPGWKSPNDPNVNSMLPAYFVYTGWSSDKAQGTYMLVDTNTAKVTGCAYNRTTLASVAAASDRVGLAASENVGSDKSFWALQTSGDIGVSGGDPVLTLGSGGLIINGNNTIGAKIRFGATGTDEALIFVAGYYTAQTRTALLTNKLITTGGLTKFGDGVLTLAGSSSDTLSGAHWVNNGTLRLAVPDALASGAQINIERGAAVEIAGNYALNYAFKGLGSILTSSNVLVATGAFTPGFSVGTLTAEDLDFRGTYNWEYDGTNSDLIACTTLAFGGGAATLNCSYLGSGKAPVGTYTLFTYKGDAPTAASWIVVPPSGLVGTVAVDSANQRVAVTFKPTPPGSILLFR
jgi:autotransporter-associated beta strand protein